MKNTYFKFEYIISLAVFIILSFVLLLNPIIGKHNNGDFGRTICISGIDDLSNSYNDIYDGFVHTKYKVNYLSLLCPWGHDWTSGVLLVKLSVLLNIIFFNYPFYYIKFLAMLYILIFCISVFLIVKYAKFGKTYIPKLGAAVFLLVYFTDIGYVSYFNSFFGEAASFVFLFLTIGTFFKLISESKPDKLSLILFFISSTLFLTAKGQNIPLVIFMLVFYFRIFLVYKNSISKKLIVSLAIMSFSICALTYASIGHTTTICNKYQTIFTGILKDSDSVESDLKKLGLSDSYRSLAGTNFFTPNMPINTMDPSLNSKLYSKISSLKVLKFYITNPKRLIDKVNISISHSFAYFPIKEGNFEKGQYSKNKLFNSFRTYLSVKYKSIYHSSVVFMLFTLIYYLIILISYIKERDKINRLLYEFLLLIGLFGTSQIILPIIGSGEADLSKHLFLLNLCYDIMFSVAVIWIINFIYAFFRSISKKSSLTNP